MKNLQRKRAGKRNKAKSKVAPYEYSAPVYRAGRTGISLHSKINRLQHIKDKTNIMTNLLTRHLSDTHY